MLSPTGVDRERTRGMLGEREELAKADRNHSKHTPQTYIKCSIFPQLHHPTTATSTTSTYSTAIRKINSPNPYQQPIHQTATMQFSTITIFFAGLLVSAIAAPT